MDRGEGRGDFRLGRLRGVNAAWTARLCRRMQEVVYAMIRTSMLGI